MQKRRWSPKTRNLAEPSDVAYQDYVDYVDHVDYLDYVVGMSYPPEQLYMAEGGQTMANRESQYLKASEVAEILAMDISTIYKMCNERVIPSIRVGEKAVRIPRAAFTAYLAKQEQGHQGRPALDEARRAGVGGEPIDAIVLRNQSFYEQTGYSSYEFADRWKSGKIEDSSENTSLLIEALSIREALTRAGIGDRVLA